MVPVPGETDWARGQRLSQHAAAVRRHAASAAGPDGGAGAPSAASPHGVKRGRGDEQLLPSSGSQGAAAGPSEALAPSPSHDGPAASADAGAVPSPAFSSSPAASSQLLLALDKPLVSDAHGDPPVLVRLYGGDVDPAAARAAGRQSFAPGPGTVGLQPKINELVEVVGVYTLDPAAPRLASARAPPAGAGAAAASGGSSRRRRHGSGAAAAAAADMALDDGGAAAAADEEEEEDGGEAAGFDEEEEEEGEGEDGRPHLPPASLVPRVHALLVRKLAPGYPALQPALGPVSASGAFALQPAGADAVGGAGAGAASSRGAAMQAAAAAAAAAAQPGEAAASAAAAAAPAAAPPTDTVVLRAAASESLRALAAAEAAAAGVDGSAARVESAAEEEGGSQEAAAEAAGAARVRAELVAYLAALLGGLLGSSSSSSGGGGGAAAPATHDELGGEYLLLHLLSAVTARAGERLSDAGGLVLGKLSLCLSGFADASGDPGTVPVQASIATPARQPGCGGTEAAAAPAAAPGDGGEPPPPLPTYTPVLPLPAGASPAGRALAGALGALLPRVALLPLRIDNLNALPFVPGKRPRDAKLRSGLLQLAPGCQVVLDETVLTGGTLGPAGVGALGALRTLARSATLAYSFPFCELPWPAEPRLLVLAPRRPLVNSCDVTLPLRPQPTGAAGAAGAPAAPPSAALLRRCRAYLATVAALPFTLPPGLAEAIQDDWVEARRAAAAAAAAAAGEDGAAGAAPPAAAVATVTQDDLHRWLPLARLAALSFGERALTPTRWAWVRALEAARAARGAGR